MYISIKFSRECRKEICVEGKRNEEKFLNGKEEIYFKMSVLGTS